MKPIRVNQSFPRMNSPRKKSAENCDLRLFLTRCDWPDFRDELDHSSGWPGLRRPFELDRSVQQSELENISTIRVTNPNKAVAVVDSESRVRSPQNVATPQRWFKMNMYGLFADPDYQQEVGHLARVPGKGHGGQKNRRNRKVLSRSGFNVRVGI